MSLSSKEISELLGVKTVTVRKYVGELEKAGYSVNRSDGGHRQYSDEDATALRHMKALCEQSGMTVEIAAKVIASRYNQAHETVAPAIVGGEKAPTERYEERYKQMIGVMEQLSVSNQQQAAELERVHRRLDDHNANLTMILREVLATRRALAEANNRKWWQVWKKPIEIDPESDPEIAWRTKNRTK